MQEHQPPTVEFDCYECTIEAEPAELIARIMNEVPGLDCESTGAMSRWSASWSLTRNRQPFCTIKVTDLRPDEPHLDCKSTAPILVPIIREHWPNQHRVSRVDACLDLYSNDYWQLCETKLLRWAVDHNIYAEPVGAHFQPHLGGRTWYLGKRQSAKRLVRVYEKGCERKLPHRWPIRVEHQVRPNSRTKERYATLTAQAVLLDNRFIAALAGVLQIDLGDVPSAAPKPERHYLDRILDVMARQYLPTLKAARERYETMDELIADLEQRRERDAEVLAAMRGTMPTEMITRNHQATCDSEAAGRPSLAYRGPLLVAPGCE